MNYYIIKSGITYLSHHGIKGQRWGIMNGPPYPLGYSDHSSLEKKKNPKSLISNDKKVNSKKDKQSIKYSKTTNAQKSVNKNKDDTFAEDLFNKNPNVAMVKPSLKEWAKEHKKEIAIGVGVAAGIAIAGIIIANRGKLKVNEIPNKDVLNAKTKIDFDQLTSIHPPNINSKEELKGFSSKQERFVANWIKADMHRFDPISQSEFDSLSSDDKIFLNSGEKLFRMSKSEHASLRDGIEYVSFGKDRDRYKGFLPNMWRVNGYKGRDFFETELVSLSDIKAPGKKESIEILEKVLKDRYGYTQKDAHSEALNDFYRYSANLIDRNDQTSKDFFSEVKSRGYNAVVDWNDAGRLADTPLILLNGKSQASINSINKYTRAETMKIFKNVELPSNSNDFSLDDFNSEELAWIYRPLINRYANGV